VLLLQIDARCGCAAQGSPIMDEAIRCGARLLRRATLFVFESLCVISVRVATPDWAMARLLVLSV
jgi:hypothetical protein